MNLQSASTPLNSNTVQRHTISTRLQGRWLALLRLVCIALSVLALILFIVSLPGYFANQQKSYTPGYAVFLFALGIFVVLVWFIVALLIFWRKSDDWMALLVSLMLVLQGADTTLNPLNSIPSFWQPPAVLVDSLAFILLSLAFCLFPTGRFVPRWIGWLAVMFTVLWLGALMVGFFDLLPTFFNQLFALALYCFLGGFVIAQIYRYHAVSSRTQRQQTKWIVFGVTATYLIEFTFTFASALFPSFFSASSLANVILIPIGNVAPILIPLSFGFAILRSHLWEIDVIIHRTLVYGTLTVLLAMIYFGVVIGLQSLVHRLTGQVLDSPLVIVGSTLLIAALFQPLRHRIQNTIDRRFYRRKYNAVRTLEAFSADLRNEVDLNTLTKRLMALVEETMQPTHISLWLRDPEASDKRNTQLLPQIDEDIIER